MTFVFSDIHLEWRFLRLNYRVRICIFFWEIGIMWIWMRDSNAGTGRTVGFVNSTVVILIIGQVFITLTLRFYEKFILCEKEPAISANPVNDLIIKFLSNRLRMLLESCDWTFVPFAFDQQWIQIQKDKWHDLRSFLSRDLFLQTSNVWDVLLIGNVHC